MKKFILIFLFAFSFMLIGSKVVLAGQQIESFYVDIQIEKNSSILVEERIYYDFGADQKHGIFRNIPFKYKSEKKNLNLKISDIVVSDENDNSLNFVLKDIEDYKQIKIGDASKTVTGVKVYKIKYRVEKAINYFSENDELYWNATGDQWEVPILQSKTTISFPEDVSENNIKVKCFTGVIGSDTSCVSQRYNYKGKGMVDKVVFTDDKLNPGEGLTVVVAIPKDLVDEPSMIVGFFSTLKDNLILLLPLFVLFGMYQLWSKKGKDPKGRETIVAQFEAPDNLTPVEIGVLVNSQSDNHEISAEIIYLATLGYLKIIKIEKDNILFDSKEYLIQKVKSGEGLENEIDKSLISKLFKEKYLVDSWKSLKKALQKGKINTNSSAYATILEALGINIGFTEEDLENVSNKNIIQLSSINKNFYKDLEQVKTEVFQSMISKGYFPHNPTTIRMRYIGLAFFVAFIGFMSAEALFGILGIYSFLASAAIIVIFGWFMPFKTKKGVLATEYILGLKDYLKVAEKDRLDFHNAPEKNPQIFERLLPFAIALKVEKNWAKQFEGMYDKNPDWYGSTKNNSFSSLALVNGLGSFSKSANASMASSPSKASSGGSGFSGGGAGGGFGGGGGGSW